jgi:hypothetical protein
MLWRDDNSGSLVPRDWFGQSGRPSCLLHTRFFSTDHDARHLQLQHRRLRAHHSGSTALARTARAAAASLHSVNA